MGPGRAHLNEAPGTATYGNTRRAAGERTSTVTGMPQIETVHLSPLPCWKHLSDETYQERVAELVQEIEKEAAAERQRTGKPVLGVEAILAQDPQYRPAFRDRSPCPLFLTASYSMWRTLYDAYAWFVLEFPLRRREAARRRSCRSLSSREFPAGIAVRRRVTLRQSVAIHRLLRRAR